MNYLLMVAQTHLLVPSRVHAMDLPPAAITSKEPRAEEGAAMTEAAKEPDNVVKISTCRHVSRVLTSSCAKFQFL